MAEIINLRKARKSRAQTAKSEAAAENRARFGRSRSERVRQTSELAKSERQLDGHEMDTRDRGRWCEGEDTQ